ncbi:hypothetical protein FIV37_16930, partial [Pseudomonas gessardii]|nr:hypothetical protein [Pseudomonas gessardii]
MILRIKTSYQPYSFVCTAIFQDRVGGGFTSAVLSHHRTYGSVYGGSGYTVKSVYRIQYRDQPE